MGTARTWRMFAVLGVAVAGAGPARAVDFYDGKTITIVVGFTPGGGYDQLARFAARHLPRFLAGRPTIVVQNLPGDTAGKKILIATQGFANLNIVTPDYIVCLEDGRKLKMLKRYLRAQYGLTPEAYRAKWNLPADYPMTAPNYAARRSAFAKQSGLGKAGGAAARKSVKPSEPERS